MFNSLKSKLIIPIVGVLVLMVFFIILYATMETSDLAETLTQQRLELSHRVATEQLNDMTARSLIVGNAVASNYTLTNGLLNWNAGIDREANRAAIFSYLAATAGELGVDSFVVRDAEGVIVLRLHDPAYYGDNDGSATGAAALRGETTVNYNTTSTMPMGQVATVPIWYQGEIIGNLATMFFLHTESFVDSFAALMGAEVTVFVGDTRTMTTYMEGGRRIIGSTIDDAEVRQTVLQQGEPLSKEIDILGDTYNALYLPLKNLAGTTIGMVYVGFSVEYVEEALLEKQLVLLAIGAASLLVTSVVMYFLITGVLKPLGGLTRAVGEIAAGNINVNIQSKLTRDEVGTLTSGISAMTDTIKDMIDDLGKLAYEIHTRGDIDYRIDTKKYGGSFNELTADINAFTDTYISEITTFMNVLTEIGAGNFNVYMEELPGKKEVMNESLNKLRSNMLSISGEIQSLIEYAANGDLSARADAGRYEGEWAAIINNLNILVQEVANPLAEAVEVMNYVAQGHFDRHINGDYKGDFLSLKTSVNTTVTNVVSYISEISEILNALAKNNLNLSITREYVGEFASIKDATVYIINMLNKVLSDMTSSAEQVSAGARLISQSGISLVASATKQASSVEALNDSIIAINESTGKNAANTHQAAQMSEEAQRNAAMGGEDMKKMMASMAGIEESSSKITQVIQVIEDIALQTNLLALNAAVEAARAGEHGRGFNVVAEEVRTLAIRSQESAKQTNDLILESSARVKEGMQIAEKTAEALKFIITNVTKTAEIIKGIAAASTEQASAIAQVKSSLALITEVAREVSTASESSVAAAEALTSQSDIMHSLASVFQLKT